MTSSLPRLTDSTVVRSICGGAKVAVAEAPGRPCVILDADDPRVSNGCGWLYEVSLSELCPSGCGCEGAHGEQWAEARSAGGILAACTAVAVDFPEGHLCANGHSHFYQVPYFDDEEIEGMVHDRTPLPRGARRMSGALVA